MQTPGNELFVKRAHEIVTELVDYYATFLDVMNFSDAAFRLLQDMSKTIVSFKVRFAWKSVRYESAGPLLATHPSDHSFTI